MGLFFVMASSSHLRGDHFNFPLRHNVFTVPGICLLSPIHFALFRLNKNRPYGFLVMKYDLEETDCSWLWIKDQVQEWWTALGKLNCPMQFTLWQKERCVHTCCVLVATSALLIGGFFCQTRNTTIVSSSTSLCKTLGEIIVFRNKSLASALCSFFQVQRMSLCVLKNDVYTLVVCL